MTHKWELGIVQNRIEGLLNGERPNVKWIRNPYKDRWFADPFILSADNEFIVLLVEEFSYKLQRGRIAKLTVSLKTYEIVNFKILLDLDTHLSFPAIFRQGSEVYVYPENCASGALNVYKYYPNTCSLEYYKTLVNRPLTDAMLWQTKDEVFLMSTEIPYQNGNALTIFKLERGSCSYKEIQTVNFKENIARNAGAVFKYKNKWYRPAQECNNSYGHGVSIQSVEFDNLFTFKEQVRLFSPYKKYNLGFHTFNVKDDYIVIDAMAFRYYYIASALRIIVRLFKKIIK